MAQPFRLSRGGRIDRTRPIVFEFNGKPVHGYAGDTVASALIANGIHLVGRSFKYHRPRGILSHGPDEPSALLSVDRGPGRTDPNNRASVVEARSGLRTASQNHWPSLEFDVGAVNDLLSPVFVAGFYYKTFMWPRKFWDRVYEPFIRAAAGLGKAPTQADPDRYANRHAHCDVLVVGAGPAGLAAALAAARTGKRVILADEGAEPGGSLLHDTTSQIDGRPAASWLAETLADLDARENVILLSRTTAFGYYNHNHVAMTERVTDHLPSAAGQAPASACGRCAPSRWCSPADRTSVRSSSPTTTGRASCSPRAYGSSSTATAWRRAASSSSPRAAPPPTKPRSMRGLRASTSPSSICAWRRIAGRSWRSCARPGPKC
ncbi:hypothetical protein GCM10025880_09720 [Methylorubrum aminovorans]|nr:hypothetical protein GCM10025880_09720 [Methylorubrum aminovorans]